MKFRFIFYTILFAGIFGISGCKSENKELKKDTKDIADVMCKSMEAMKNLKMANPADSVQVKKLQAEYKNIQTEMTILYQEFKTKYGEKATTKEFNEEFRKYLSESMLDCKSLSKEDRETFEKGMK
jgi:predicted nuclease with TOPRIM domain